MYSVSMKPLSDFIKPIEKKSGGINSPFSNAVGLAIEIMGDEAREKKFGYWCGRLRGVPVQKIHEWISVCKREETPIKLFQWLVKEYRSKQSQHKTDDKTS